MFNVSIPCKWFILNVLHIFLNSRLQVVGSITLYLLNPQFHWLRQIATTLSEFHLQFWIFLDAIAKAKKLIHESIAQNLKRVSLTKSFLALAMAFNLLLSNLT